MSSSRDRGPNDYADDPDYLKAVIEGMVRAGNGYHESSDKGLLKWILGVLTALLILLIPTMIVVYSDVQTLKTQQTEMRDQIRELRSIVVPHYRGGDPAS